MSKIVEKVADRIQARMGPLFGSPEYLADPVKMARSLNRQRESAVSYARIAVEEASSISKDEAEALRAAIKSTEYKYFGDYELSPDQWKAVDTLVEFAQRHLDSTPTSETDQLGGVGV